MQLGWCCLSAGVLLLSSYQVFTFVFPSPRYVVLYFVNCWLLIFLVSFAYPKACKVTRSGSSDQRTRNLRSIISAVSSGAHICSYFSSAVLIMWVDTVLSLHDWKLSAAVSGITDVYDSSHEEKETFIFTCLLLRYNILEASRYKKKSWGYNV